MEKPGFEKPNQITTVWNSAATTSALRSKPPALRLRYNILRNQNERPFANLGQRVVISRRGMSEPPFAAIARFVCTRTHILRDLAAFRYC